MTVKAETLIIGSGVIGSSVAMHLARMGMKGIRVVDPDLEGTLSSSELNAGGVRATFAQPVNIELSKDSIEYFSEVAQEVGYRACGYLWLNSPERLPVSLKLMERQLASGWPVEAWDLAELRRRNPFIDKTEGIAGAIFAPRDGLVNPNLLKNHFRAEARALGVVFDDRTNILGSEGSEASGGRIRVRAERFRAPLSEDQKREFFSGRGAGVETEVVWYDADRVVNCAGAWASGVARALGYETYAKPVRRQICIFDCRDVDLTKYGMVIDTSGVYFHPEATNGLAGYANHSEPEGANYHYDGESFFMDVIWPALYERSSAFEKLKHLTGWAGLYEVSPDESAILGKVSDRVYEAHSFSGHGVMQSYAAGRALAELMVRGRYETVDASMLGGSRFETGKLVKESAVI